MQVKGSSFVDYLLEKSRVVIQVCGHEFASHDAFKLVSFALFFFSPSSRLCSQSRGERNFHAFYYLLNGNDSISDRERFFLHDTYDYTYLGGGPTSEDLHDDQLESVSPHPTDSQDAAPAV